MEKYTSRILLCWLEDLNSVEGAYGLGSPEYAYQMDRTVAWLRDGDRMKQVLAAANLHAPSDRPTKTAEGAEERLRGYIASIPKRIAESR